MDRRILRNWTKNGDKHANSYKKRNSFNLKSEKFRSDCEVKELRIKDWILDKRSEGICLDHDVRS